MLPETNDFSIFTTISLSCISIVYISSIYILYRTSIYVKAFLSPYLTSFFHFNRKKYAQNSSFQNRSVHSFSIFVLFFLFQSCYLPGFSSFILLSCRVLRLSVKLLSHCLFPIRTVTFFSVSEESQASAFSIFPANAHSNITSCFQTAYFSFCPFFRQCRRIVITPSWL